MLVTAWLIGMVVALNPSESDDSNRLRLAVALLVIVPFGLWLCGGRFFSAPVFRNSPASLLLLAAFLSFSLVGSIVSVRPDISLGYWATTVAGIIICAGVWGLLAGGLYRALSLYSLIGTVANVVIAWMTYTSGSRFTAYRGPNSIGMIVMSLLICAFAIAWRPLRIGVIVSCLILIYLTHSRAAILGTGVAISLLLMFRYRRMSDRSFLELLVAGLVIIVVTLTMGSILADAGAEVLALNDPYRGLKRGASGRFSVWAETFDLWLEHPLMGVGYRSHEFYVSISSSHNGYLSTLAETGLVGAIPLFSFVALGSLRLFRWAAVGQLWAQLGVSLIAGYLCICFFERYLLNVGNPASLLVLIFLLHPSEGPSKGVVGVRFRQYSLRYRSGLALPQAIGKSAPPYGVR